MTIYFNLSMFLIDRQNHLKSIHTKWKNWSSKLNLDVI